MVEVYQYLDLIPDVVAWCDDIWGYSYEELQKKYENTVLSCMSAQQLIDVVEDAIRCADSPSKIATIRRLNRRIKAARSDVRDVLIDFRHVDGPGMNSLDFLSEIRDTLDEFSFLVEQLCDDYKIAREKLKDDKEPALRLSAMEGALVYYYEFGKFITSVEEAEKAIKLYGIMCTPDSMLRKCRSLRVHADIVGANDSLKDNRSTSFNRVIQYLRAKELPTNKVEADLAQYIMNRKAEK